MNFVLSALRKIEQSKNLVYGSIPSKISFPAPKKIDTKQEVAQHARIMLVVLNTTKEEKRADCDRKEFKMSPLGLCQHWKNRSSPGELYLWLGLSLTTLGRNIVYPNYTKLKY